MEIKNGLEVIAVGTLRDSEGNIKQRFTKHNLVTTVGFDFLCAAFGSDTRPNAMRYLAVGTGTTAPAVGNTAMENQLARQKATYAHTASTKALTLTTTFAAGTATGALTEAGILNASSGGTLFDRITFPVINKGALDTFQLVFTITFAEA